MTGPYRYRTTGCGSPWIVAPDRGRVRNDGARFVRAADEPPAWLGVLIVAFGLFTLIAVILIVSAIVYQTPRASAATPAASINTPAGIEAVGGGNRGAR